MPGLPTDCELQRTGRSTDRFSTDQGHQEEEEAEDHQKTTSRPRTEPPDLTLCVPLYLLWLIAPPSFQLLREASRKEALPISNALLLLVYRSALLPTPAGSFQKGGVTHFQRLAPMNRPMTNDLPFVARGKNRRENPRTIGIPSSFSWRYWNPLFLFLGRDGFISREGCSGVVEKVIGSWRSGEGG